MARQALNKAISLNPIQEDIRKRVNRLPAFLAPLKEACLRNLHYCSAIDTDDTILVAHRPWEGPLNYFISLYPGAKDAWFAKYRQDHKLAIPTLLHPLLKATNGCFVFGLSLYGMAPSMLKSPARVNRSTQECHDLSMATGWTSEYAVDDSWFHFGSRTYSDTQNAGYFLDPKNRIVSVLRGGKVIGEWPKLTAFLDEELQASEKRERAEDRDEWWH